MADFYFGADTPDYASNWAPIGGSAAPTILANLSGFTMVVPAGGIIITELARGMDSAPSQAGATFNIGVYDITNGRANAPMLVQTTVTSRSDNAGYVWHTSGTLSTFIAAGKIIAIGSTPPTVSVWHTRQADGTDYFDDGSSETTLPSNWNANGTGRIIPFRAGYSLAAPPATLYGINSNDRVAVGSTGNSISTAGINTLTSVTIGGKAAINLSAPGGDGTFDMPPFADGVAYALLGTATAVATDGSNTANKSVILDPPDGHDFVTLAGTINTSNTGVLYQFSPAAVVGNQIVFPLAIKVDAQGNVEGDQGTYTLYEIRVSDGMVRTVALTLGGAGSDTTPDAFGFNTPALAALGATVTSTNTTISGINAAAAVSVTGGLVSINGGAFVSSGTITNGQTIAARVTASNSYSTAVTATVNIGGVSAQFTATTIADPGPPPDTTPDAISFPANTNCTPNSAQSSAVRTIAGINTASPITAATNCTYSVAGGAATSANGSISNGQTIQLFAVASGTPGATVNASITIGGQVFTWAVLTGVAQQQITENRPQSNIGAFGKPTKKRRYKMALPQTPNEKGLTQSSPEDKRTLTVDLAKCETYKMFVGIEKSAGATGTVEIWAHEVTAGNFALVDSVNLANITEKDYTPLEGPFDKLRAVPVGVTGSFNFSCVAY